MLPFQQMPVPRTRVQKFAEVYAFWPAQNRLSFAPRSMRYAL
jgi:hypothetical protein